jgi:hypothetical protein
MMAKDIVHVVFSFFSSINKLWGKGTIRVEEEIVGMAWSFSRTKWLALEKIID